jgi:hypothetical protein
VTVYRCSFAGTTRLILYAKQTKNNVEERANTSEEGKTRKDLNIKSKDKNDRSKIQKDKSLKALVKKGEIIEDSNKEMQSCQDMIDIGEEEKKTLYLSNYKF